MITQINDNFFSSSLFSFASYFSFLYLHVLHSSSFTCEQLIDDPDCGHNHHQHTSNYRKEQETRATTTENGENACISTNRVKSSGHLMTTEVDTQITHSPHKQPITYSPLGDLSPRRKRKGPAPLPPSSLVLTCNHTDATSSSSFIVDDDQLCSLVNTNNNQNSISKSSTGSMVSTISSNESPNPSLAGGVGALLMFTNSDGNTLTRRRSLKNKPAPSPPSSSSNTISTSSRASKHGGLTRSFSEQKQLNVKDRLQTVASYSSELNLKEASMKASHTNILINSQDANNEHDMDDSLIIDYDESSYIYSYNVYKLADNYYTNQKVPPEHDPSEISLSRDASVQVNLKILNN